MFCTHCGGPLQGAVKFCPHCGGALEVVATTSVPDWSMYTRPEQETEAPQSQEFVWPEFMQTPVEPEFKQPEEKKQPINKKKLILGICAVVLVLATVAAVLLQTVKKTVYLPVRNVLMQQDVENEWVFDYDAQGRLTKMEYAQQIELNGIIAHMSKMTVYYFYQPNGNMKRAELYIDQDGDLESRVVVEYQYQADVLQDFSMQMDDEKMPLDVKCDKKGRITEVWALDEDGEKEGGWEFAYYGNGGVSQNVFRSGSVRQEQKYDRDGRIIQQEAYIGDQLQYKLVREYDEHGNLTRQTRFMEDGLMLTGQQTIEITYTYQKDRIVDMQIRTQERKNEETLHMTVDFVCRWDGDGKDCEMTVETVDGEGSLLGLSKEEQDFCILLQKDKNGNTTFYEVLLDDEQILQQEYRYEEYKLPWYYEVRDQTSDPMYLYFFAQAFFG